MAAEAVYILTMKTSPISSFLASAIKSSISYEPETGQLIWLERSAETFRSSQGRSAEACAAAFNAQFAGRPALSCLSSHGYLHGNFLGKRIYAHQAAWFLHTGCWPELVIDHINGEKTDNRSSNLREVEQRINLRNAARWSHNRSGITGVSPSGRLRKPWQAAIQVNGRHYHLGNYSTEAEAIAARRAAERVSGFTSRHGR